VEETAMMKYAQHRHDGIIKPGEHIDPSVKAAPQLHDLLERKGFSFQVGPDYYCFGKDAEWESRKNLLERPLISVYKSGGWDGRPVPGYPMKPDTELKEYSESLPEPEKDKS
jgi:hypothetical protein